MKGMKLAAFDLDGVIVDSVEAKRRAISHEIGRKVRIEEAVNGSFKHLIIGSVYNKAMERLYTTRHFFGWCEPFEGVREVLVQLAEEGHRIRIVSKAKGLPEASLKELCMNYALPVNEFVTGQKNKTPYFVDADVVVEDTLSHLMPLLGMADIQPILFRHETRAEGIIPQDVPFKTVRNWMHLGNLLCKEPPVMAAA